MKRKTKCRFQWFVKPPSFESIQETNSSCMNFCKRSRVGIGKCILFLTSAFSVKLVHLYLCNVTFVNVMTNTNLLSLHQFFLFVYMYETVTQTLLMVFFNFTRIDKVLRYNPSTCCKNIHVTCTCICHLSL